MEKEKLQKYHDLAYHYAIYKIGDIEIAEEIAAKTINLYLLKEDVINNIEPWIISTCYNYCNQYFKSLKNDSILKEKLRDNVIDLMSNQETERNVELYNAYKKTLDEMSEEDIRIVLFYHYCNKNAKKMANLTGDSYDKLRKRIYRIKQTIKAETFKKLGVVASEKILSPRLENMIMKFLKSFKYHVENNSIYKMYYYFSEIDLKKYNPDFEIDKIVDYRLNLKENIYTVYVGFTTKKNEVDSFYVKFIINDKNHFKIVTPPQKMKKAISFDANSKAANEIRKLLHKYPEDRTGISTIPKEELEKILKEIQNK
jgi:DNA-directed RNA polymerase specialized sigma24 family protein